MRIYKALILLGLVLTLGFNSVPKIQDSILKLTAPIFYDSSFNKEWDNFNNQLITTPSKTIIVNWSGYGGWDYIGDRTINAIKIAHTQGKKIIFKLSNDAISMHANVACYVDSIEYKGHAIIFHSGIDGRNKNGTRHYINDRSYFNYCKIKGFITEEDIQHILKLRQRVEVYYDHKKYREDYP